MIARVVCGILAVLSVALSVNASITLEPSKVDSLLINKMRTSESADVIVYMKETADLSLAKNIKDRTQRIKYVYDQLRAQALKSQPAVINQLKKNQIPHKSFFIENVISVKKASAKTLKMLTALPEVGMIRLDAQSKLVLPKVNKLSELEKKQTIPNHLISIGVDKVWNELNVKGKGIVVAGQDTGYYWQHNAIKNKYRGYRLGAEPSHDYN